MPTSATQVGEGPWKPVLLRDVTIDDRFWSKRIKINREQTIPAQYALLQQTGRIRALQGGWAPGETPVPHIFWDSDIAKWIEAACYSLVTHPDSALEQQIDETIALLTAAQKPDGYLNTYFTLVKPGERWTDLRDGHELYCAGHLIEAAVAHFEATGKRTLLQVVSRYADHIGTVFGTGPGQKRGYCGHPEIELALVKLFRATGERRYLSLAQYFVNQRGQKPYYFEVEAEERGAPGFSETDAQDWKPAPPEYRQAHMPVRQQHKVVGHAVRAMYLYCAMADLGVETGDTTLLQACERLWRHLCSTRMYVTGGIGSSRQNEGFTEDYDLPNEAAYAETCAAIGLVFWAQRMAHAEQHGQYVDVLERALYNGVISGVSVDGTRFFYDNPLASLGGVDRQPWFDCACCPPNLARLLASLGSYIYSMSAADVVVQLYVQSRIQLTVQSQVLLLEQQTDYPWDGAVRLGLKSDVPVEFTLRLRIPGWCHQANARLNGVPVDVAANVQNGYLCIARTWHGDDRVELDLSMPVDRVYAHPSVTHDIGCVALRRGPLVYCVEEIDNPTPLHRLMLPRNTQITPLRDGDLVTLRADALIVDDDNWHGRLYRYEPPDNSPAAMTAIPYYAWNNRGLGQMRVWVRETQLAATTEGGTASTDAQAMDKGIDHG